MLLCLFANISTFQPYDTLLFSYPRLTDSTEGSDPHSHQWQVNLYQAMLPLLVYLLDDHSTIGIRQCFFHHHLPTLATMSPTHLRISETES